MENKIESNIFNPFEDPYSKDYPISFVEDDFGLMESDSSDESFVNFDKDFNDSLSVDEKGRRVFRVGEYRFVELLKNKEDQRLHHEGIIRFLNRFRPNEDDCIQNIYQIRSMYNSDIDRKGKNDLGAMMVLDANNKYIAQFISYQYSCGDHYKKPFLRAAFRTCRSTGSQDFDVLNLINSTTKFLEESFYILGLVNVKNIDVCLLYYYCHWFFLSKVEQKYEDIDENVFYNIILSKNSILDILGIEKEKSNKESFLKVSKFLKNNPSTLGQLKVDMKKIIEHYIKI